MGRGGHPHTVGERPETLRRGRTVLIISGPSSGGMQQSKLRVIRTNPAHTKRAVSACYVGITDEQTRSFHSEKLAPALGTKRQHVNNETILKH